MQSTLSAPEGLSYCIVLHYLSSPTCRSETSDADTCPPPLDEFRNLIGAQTGQEIRQLEPDQWDTRGEYKDIVDAVATACSGSAVRVYRVEGSGSRVEYFIVGVDTSEKRVVGVKALSVES